MQGTQGTYSSYQQSALPQGLVEVHQLRGMLGGLNMVEAEKFVTQIVSFNFGLIRNIKKSIPNELPSTREWLNALNNFYPCVTLKDIREALVAIKYKKTVPGAGYKPALASSIPRESHSHLLKPPAQSSSQRTVVATTPLFSKISATPSLGHVEFFETVCQIEGMFARYREGAQGWLWFARAAGMQNHDIEILKHATGVPRAGGQRFHQDYILLRLCMSLKQFCRTPPWTRERVHHCASSAGLSFPEVSPVSSRIAIHPDKQDAKPDENTLRWVFRQCQQRSQTCIYVLALHLGLSFHKIENIMGIPGAENVAEKILSDYLSLPLCSWQNLADGMLKAGVCRLLEDHQFVEVLRAETSHSDEAMEVSPEQDTTPIAANEILFLCSLLPLDKIDSLVCSVATRLKEGDSIISDLNAARYRDQETPSEAQHQKLLELHKQFGNRFTRSILREALEDCKLAGVMTRCFYPDTYGNPLQITARIGQLSKELTEPQKHSLLVQIGHSGDLQNKPFRVAVEQGILCQPDVARQLKYLNDLAGKAKRALHPPGSTLTPACLDPKILDKELSLSDIPAIAQCCQNLANPQRLICSLDPSPRAGYQNLKPDQYKGNVAFLSSELSTLFTPAAIASRQQMNYVFNWGSLINALEDIREEVNADNVRIHLGLTPPEGTADRPDKQELYSVFEQCCRCWHALAGHLGFSRHELANIQCSYLSMGDIYKELVTRYMKRRSASWDQVCNALYKAGACELAEKTRKQHCLG